jgi:hypothetical protein
MDFTDKPVIDNCLPLLMREALSDYPGTLTALSG